MLLYLQCLLTRHLWCWDPHRNDTFERGGPIVTCARCGSESTGYGNKTLTLTPEDMGWLSREGAEMLT